MKGKIIEVNLHNDGSTTLYMCCSEDETNKYFICLENEYPMNKYIRISKLDFNKENKNNNFRDCCETIDQYEALFEIRRNIEYKK